MGSELLKSCGKLGKNDRFHHRRLPADHAGSQFDHLTIEGADMLVGDHFPRKDPPQRSLAERKYVVCLHPDRCDIVRHQLPPHARKKRYQSALAPPRLAADHDRPIVARDSPGVEPEEVRPGTHETKYHLLLNPRQKWLLVRSLQIHDGLAAKEFPKAPPQDFNNSDPMKHAAHEHLRVRQLDETRDALDVSADRKLTAVELDVILGGIQKWCPIRW